MLGFGKQVMFCFELSGGEHGWSWCPMLGLSWSKALWRRCPLVSWTFCPPFRSFEAWRRWLWLRVVVDRLGLLSPLLQRYSAACRRILRLDKVSCSVLNNMLPRVRACLFVFVHFILLLSHKHSTTVNDWPLCCPFILVRLFKCFWVGV